MNNTEISTIIRKRTLGLVFALSAASLAFAQEKINISGKVVDTNNQPVPYASVTFSHPTNKLYSDAALTDEKGNYKIQLVPANYKITLEAIDYKNKTLTKDIATAGNIGSFSIEKETTSTLTPTQNIEGVTIVAAAPKTYKVELDKKVYDPSQDLVSKGGNLQDVLTNVPSVSVDTDGTVSMRGNSNVKFLINGKPSSLLGIDDGADALQSIPADEIERIEVITNPSSKFEASGTAGILNIILKKNKKAGFNGTVTGTLGYLPQTNLNASLNWKKGNWTWYVNGGGGYRKNESSSYNSTFNKTDPNSLDLAKGFPFTQSSVQDGKSKREGSHYNATAGVIYDLSDKTSINFSGMIRTYDNDQMTNNDYQEKVFSDPTTFANTFRNRLSNGNNKNLATQFDFGIDQKLDDNGQNLSFSASGQTNKSDGANIINTNSYIDDVWQQSGFKVNNVNTDSKSTSFIGKLDYELPIGEQSKLEAGARYDYNKHDYNYFVTQSLDGTNFDMMKDFTSNTTYKENILGVYAQFNSKLGDNFAYQLGLRSETSGIDIDFNYYDRTTGQPANNKVNKTYTKLFPTVFLSYNIGNNQLLLNYSRRINRPRAFSLIPFMSFDDDRNYFRGNPNLNPTYENSFELGYNISKKKFTFNPTIYFKKSEDEQNRFQYVDETGAINTVPYNVGSETNYGLDLNGTYDPFSWWKMMLSADLYGYDNTGKLTIDNVTNDFSGDGFSYRLRFNNTFKIDKTFSIQAQSFYRAGEKTAMTDRKAMYGVDFGASKTIWKGNGTIALNLRDAFNTRKMKFYSDTPQFTRLMEMQWQPRQVSVSFTYRFKQGEKIEIKKKTKDINNNFSGEDDGQPPM